MFPPQLQRAFTSATRQMGRATRLTLAALSLSAAGLVGIAVHEGYSGKAYPDPVLGAKVPTIGFGSTEGVRMGDTTDPVAALQRKLRDVQKFEGALRQCVAVPLSQAEFDAYLNFSYNVGAAAFCGSTLVKRLNAGDYTGACDAILDWYRVGKVDCRTPGNTVCGGLWKRRQALHRQCLGSDQP